uniref:Uncharacterized protein n=1 Tax=Dunaliella tertiolecta TaxID=3047 RepID=A0A7S3VSR7_DUNTE|mmetsp:Transcript_10114/g.27672  ORF Transcript_10114/g.27672 Transcript_10114/m.27672 type:complete len:211 (-) Transcript_10114:343-975(-)|eukprot:CAMPEP_0202378776 /NCGR_PEP_ID=MMETSP1127-20130417/20492_1 /ASSEMBLY_ACC=CAM_ASM_000462 /TAXON_ID=3047 /ORGANISM="Dunaliella tertiolecta, Strain CCMP1320" /LENGTH=210 /DNA_ID=CAMNT_0048977157 /DNA_START=106 /DNA_END=738 /DNA_ORIENTATION=-
MQALQYKTCSTTTRIQAPQRARSSKVVVRATPSQRRGSTDESQQNPFLAVTLSALLAVNITAAPMVQPQPANATADPETIQSKAEQRRERMRQARLKAEQGGPGAIPCVTIGCSADSEEAAAKRKKEAEARQEEVKRQAQAVYDRERERKEKNFSDIEAKSSFTGEQESLLKERIRNAEQLAAESQAAPPAKAPPLRALQGAGIFGSGDE